VKLVVPVTIGVPEIRPAGVSVSPIGSKVPFAKLQV